jgi:hypothetical protein
MPAFPEVRVGDPVAHGALAVFPLFAETPGRVEDLLADEAIAAGSVFVEEVGQAGSVTQRRPRSTHPLPCQGIACRTSLVTPASVPYPSPPATPPR